MAELLEKGVTSVSADTIITTTTETVAATSPQVKVPVATARIVIRGWLQVATGAATTTITLRIRRGTLITDPLVGESNPVNVSAAAGSTEEHVIQVSELVQDAADATYVLTCQQGAAGANGTILQAHVEVEVLSG